MYARILHLVTDDLGEFFLHFAINPRILNAVLSHSCHPLSCDCIDKSTILRKRIVFPVVLPWHFNHDISLNQVVLMYIIEILKDQSALISGLDFLDIILKPL